MSATTTSGLPSYYTRDPTGGLIDERTTGLRLDVVTDALGSIVALTDSNGLVAASYTYDPYGNTTAATFATDAYGTLAQNNPFRYTSGYLDPTGLYHLGERYYDPTIGRFTQPDPAQDILNPMQANPYAYTADDPVNYVDPTGTSSCGRSGGFTWGSLWHGIWGAVKVVGGAAGVLAGAIGAVGSCWDPFTLEVCAGSFGGFVGGIDLARSGVQDLNSHC